MDLLFLCEASTSLASPYSKHQEMQAVSVNSMMQVSGVVALVQGTVFSHDLLWGRQGPCSERTERTRPLLIVDACLCVLGKNVCCFAWFWTGAVLSHSALDLCIQCIRRASESSSSQGSNCCGIQVIVT